MRTASSYNNGRIILPARVVIMVGRDIGTVVLPDAPLKIYLDAALDVRARRRLSEQVARVNRPTIKPSFHPDDMRRRDALTVAAMLRHYAWPWTPLRLMPRHWQGEVVERARIG